MEPNSTETLFLAWREGSDLRALAQVFDETAPELYAVARHLARGTSAAEDLLQETFLAAIERAASYDGARPLRPWLFGILGTQARKLHARRQPVALEERAGPAAEPLDELVRAELHGAVALAVESLPAHYASAVALHLEQGLPPREIATRLSISSELARTHLSRGLAWLRRALPEGLSTGAWIGSERLDSLRERVLAQAGASAKATPALSGVLLSALLLLPLAAVGGGVAWLLDARSGSHGAAALVLAGASAESAAAGGAGERAQLESAAPAVARQAATPPAAGAGASASATRVHGIVKLADGTPASGTVVRASAFAPGETSTHELARASCAAKGEFQLVFDAPADGFASLRVTQPGQASAGCNLSDLAPAGDLDTGELVLARAATLKLELVDAEKRPLAEGWRVATTADAPQTHPANKRWIFWSGAEVDARDGSCVLPDIVGCEMTVLVTNRLASKSLQQKLKLVEGQEVQAQFRYEGPDLRQRIVVRAFPSWTQIRALDPAPGSVKLFAAAESAPRAPTSSQPGQIVFDGLSGEDYRLEIDDPNFEPWSAAHVKPGQALSVKLVGAASVHLVLRGPQGEPIAKYGLGLRFPDVNFRPNDFELWRKGSPAPQDGLVRGLFPVHCTLLVRPEGLAERALDVTALRRGETRELTLDFGVSAAISGRVTDDRGQPLEGVALELTQGERAGSESKGFTTIARGRELQAARPIAAKASSKADGRFAFRELERGVWTVRARFSPWLAADQTLTLGAEAAPPLELARPACGFLAGSVVLPKGVDAATIEILIGDESIPWRARGASQPDVVLAQDGSFQAGPLPAGTHVLRAIVPGGSSGAAQSFGSFRELGQVLIRAGAQTERVLDLSGELPLQIALVVRAGGAPLEQGWVVGLCEDKPAGSIALGSQGRATIALPAKTSLHLVVVARELGWIWRPEESFLGASGETLERKLEIPLVEHTLVCIDAATRAPLAAHEIRWSAVLGELAAQAQGKTDAQGGLELSLPAGTHVFSDGARTGGTPTSVEWSAAPGAPIELAIRTSG